MHRYRTYAAACCLALAGAALTAPSASAWGNGWDYCSKVSMTNKNSSVRINGNCDGGKLKLNGTWNKRSGSFDFRGRLGADRVQLSGFVNNVVIFNGWIGDAYVDMDGSEMRGTCTINGWIDDEYDTGYPTSMLGRVCGLMSYNL